MAVARAPTVWRIGRGEVAGQSRNLAKRHRRGRHRGPAGTPPGTLQADPAAQPPRIRVVAYGGGELLECEADGVDAIRDLRTGRGVVWVDVSGLGDVSVVQRIGEMFDLHPLALEDVLNVTQRPKVEEYGEHVFIVTRMPIPDDPGHTEQIAIFLGRGFVVTFQEVPGRDCIDPVRERIRRQRTRIVSAGPDYLAYAVLDAIVDAYFPLLDELGDRLEAVEAEVLRGDDRTVVGRLHALTRELTGIRRVLLPLRESIAQILREETPFVTDATRLYLRDTLDHTIRLIELVESQRDLASSVLHVYLTLASNRLNDVMKVLTIITTVFMPLGLIAGIYGMNFDRGASPWNMPELGWRYGYVFALGVMVAVGAAMLLFFRGRKWF
jgi:magnesium transporter